MTKASDRYHRSILSYSVIWWAPSSYCLAESKGATVSSVSASSAPTSRQYLVNSEITPWLAKWRPRLSEPQIGACAQKSESLICFVSLASSADSMEIPADSAMLVPV